MHLFGTFLLAESYLSASMDRKDVKSHEPVDHLSLELNKVSLNFETTSSDGKKKPSPLLNTAFEMRNAIRYRTSVRWSTFVLGAISLFMIPYDINRFGAGSDRFLAALLLRLCGIVPLCIGVILFTYSDKFRTHSRRLLIPGFCVGGIVVAYSILSEDPGTSLLSLRYVSVYVATTCFLSKCRLWNVCVFHSVHL